VVAAGSVSYENDAGIHFAAIRYRGDGTLDPSFGDGGVVETHFDGLSGVGALALEADGSLLAVGGVTQLPPVGKEFLAIARYRPDGSLDATFGEGGKIQTLFDSDDDLVVLSGVLAIQADGRMIVRLGHDLARYTANGALDQTFGTGGIAEQNIIQLPNAAAVQSDGKIVVVNLRSGPSVVARFNADGSVDESFGDGGVSAGPESGIPSVVAVQGDGKIVVGELLPEEHNPFVLLRLIGQQS
jgi:uncharacterized delta-60 repeat protein